MKIIIYEITFPNFHCWEYFCKSPLKIWDDWNSPLIPPSLSRASEKRRVVGRERDGWSANPFFLLVDSSRSMNRCRSHETGINFPRFASYWSCLTSTIVWKGWRSNGSNDSSSFRHGVDFFSYIPLPSLFKYVYESCLPYYQRFFNIY